MSVCLQSRTAGPWKGHGHPAEFGVIVCVSVFSFSSRTAGPWGCGRHHHHPAGRPDCLPSPRTVRREQWCRYLRQWANVRHVRSQLLDVPVWLLIGAPSVTDSPACWLSLPSAPKPGATGWILLCLLCCQSNRHRTGRSLVDVVFLTVGVREEPAVACCHLTRLSKTKHLNVIPLCPTWSVVKIKLQRPLYAVEQFVVEKWLQPVLL